MALPTQPNGSSVVPLTGGPQLAGATPSLNQSGKTESTLNVTTGQTEAETISVIIN